MNKSIPYKNGGIRDFKILFLIKYNAGESHELHGIEGKIAGLDPMSGKTLWEHRWKIFLNNVQIAQPLKLFDDSFLLSAGYGKGAERISVKKSGDHYLLETVWKTKTADLGQK